MNTDPRVHAVSIGLIFAHIYTACIRGSTIAGSDIAPMRCSEIRCLKFIGGSAPPLCKSPNPASARIRAAASACIRAVAA